VAIIITKLFNLVKPNVAIFGEKDFQKLLIIKKLVKDLNFDIEIIALPTLREASGLAMSSRNSRLSIQGRIKASLIFQTLNEIRENPSLIENKKKELIGAGFEKIDYLEIRSEHDLKLIKDINSRDEKRIFIAIYLEGIRLIDNIKI
jgi:pantoate--beta-alanine ligase